ncbi:hypothetical protein EAH77_05920 [Ewingella americana]|uniref:Uncharacterized protein n=1 Tax=Ewingella americana TaxID=41202 RepID=A0A502GPB8_9GAMM|nr:hypothetical protein EAH77_05920 [Ewingella americana]
MHLRAKDPRLLYGLIWVFTCHIFCILKSTDPDPKSCSIQKQNSGMIMTPLNGGCTDEKVTIHRRADCFCPEAG